MRKRVVLLGVGAFLVLASPTYAADFTTSYDVTYQVQEDGLTRVTQDIVLTNHTQDRYVAEYTLTIGSETIGVVHAVDSKGTITPEVTVEGGQTKIRTVFNDQVVGEGKVLEWTIAYTDSAVAKRIGSVWEVALPRLGTQSGIAGYQVTVAVPASFGPLLYSSPYPEGLTVTADSGLQLVFSKAQFEQTGVLIGFGEGQLFDFLLKYQLKNSHPLKATTEIALPPDIVGEQRMTFSQLTPPPLRVRVDEDGNYLAQYQLAGKQELEVLVGGQAQIFHPQRNLGQSGFLDDIPNRLRGSYTTPQEYWEVNNVTIRQLAAQLTQKDWTVAQNARSIYHWVVSELEYNAERAKGTIIRLGAAAALENPDQAVCTEFGDTLVTLLRAAGIPARGLEGYAYTEDEDLRPTLGDILHAWVQVYLPNIGWVTVDPTWGATTGLDYFDKLDTNHFVFAIKGLDSKTPYPAGSYRLGPESTGNINVSFGEVRLEGEPRLEAEVRPFGAIRGLILNLISGLPIPQVSGLPIQRQLILRNVGSATAFGVQTKPQKGGQGLTLGILPPYGEISFVPEAEEATIEVVYQDFNGQTYQQQLTPTTRSYRLNLPPWAVYGAAVAGAVVGLTIVIIVVRKRMVRKKNKSPVAEAPLRSDL